MPTLISFKPNTALRLNRLKNLALVMLLVGSLALTVANQSVLSRITHEVSTVKALALVLLICEVAFVAGALLMMASLGVKFEERTRIHAWWKHLKYARREIKTMATQALTSKLFGFGFWLNFAGAVGTSLVLAVTVIKFAPVVGWGLLVVIIVDLIATFAWRIPVHMYRKARMKTHD
jgi:hypothetical protein